MKTASSIVPVLVLLASASAANTMPAQRAVCRVGGDWTIYHGHGAITPVSVEQTGMRLIGTAQNRNTSGLLTQGRVSGRDVMFKIKWSNGPVGDYSGRIDARGQLRGVNYQVGTTNSTEWWARRKFSCA